MAPLTNLQVITEDGGTYSLWNNFVHLQFLDNVGLPPITRILEKSPLQHGAMDRGFRLEPREMTLQLVIGEGTAAEADEARDFVTRLFAPTNEPLSLRMTRDDGQIRQIDCYVNGTADYPMSTRTGGGQLISVPLLAPEPSFYNPTQNQEEVSASSGTGQVQIPIAGISWEDWPIIEIDGPWTAAFLAHSESGYQLDINAVSPAIADGQTFTIDFRPNQKTVLYGVNNRLDYISSATVSYLGQIRVYSEKDIKLLGSSNTYNTFILYGTGYGANSALRVSWYSRYLSL